MADFVGRAETRVKYILESFFMGRAAVQSQVHIQNVIKKEDFDILGKEHNQHKFDLIVLFYGGRPHLVIEVNYKHKLGAGRKWNNVYSPAIIKAGKIPLAVNDFECTSLFDTDKPRALVWDDYIDVINALKIARISP